MSLKNTIPRLQQIEPLVTIVLRLVRLVRVESPLARLEQVVSIGHAWILDKGGCTPAWIVLSICFCVLLLSLLQASREF